jgi:hypothetical protein
MVGENPLQSKDIPPASRFADRQRSSELDREGSWPGDQPYERLRRSDEPHNMATTMERDLCHISITPCDSMAI